MDVTLGMHVYTSDEQDLGTVDRLILDPERGTVKAAVVSKGFFLPQDVEVPVELFQAGPSGDARISYSSTDIDKLPSFAEGDYTAPPPDYLAQSNYPATAIYWPVGYSLGMTPLDTPAIDNMPVSPWTGDVEVDKEVATALRRQDLENAVIGEGSEVLGQDGKKVGTVRELTFDPASGELTGLVVHKGVLLGKETSLPAALIDSVDDGVVYLAVDAQEAIQ